MLFFRVRGYCIELNKIKAMSIYLFWIFEEMLSMKFFWNIQRKRNYPWAIYRNSKYPIRRLLWWHKTLLDAIWTQVHSEPLIAIKMESFLQTVNGLKSLTGHAKTLHLRWKKGFWWICFCWKARQVWGVQNELSMPLSKTQMNVIYILKNFNNIS